MSNKKDLIIREKIKIINDFSLKDVSYWQIRKYNFFLKKGSKSKVISHANIKHLINVERELKAFFVLWSIKIESKAKAVLEEIFLEHASKNEKYDSVFYSKNYANKVLKPHILKALKKARKEFESREKETYEFLKSKNIKIDIQHYISNLTFASTIEIATQLKKPLRLLFFSRMKITPNFVGCLSLIREIRNLSAHDQSILDYQSSSYVLPRNIISSAISPFIHSSQKKDNMWNKNLISIVISFRLLLSKPQFKKFSTDYKNILKKLSRALPKNIIYYRLSGGNIQTLDKLEKLNSPKLMDHNDIAMFNLSELRKHYEKITGTYVHFENRNEAISRIIEIFQ